MPERERDGTPERLEPAPAVDPSPAAIELPATFGKYFLTEKLATGGMAEIYLAKIVGPGGFEKQLVIKQIHPRLSGQRHFVDLFVAEAKTLVTLAHGNIVPVYELGVIDDTYFIAMEYIDGPTLYRLTETLRRKAAAMEPALAAWVTARILEGLDYAHRKGEGVIHRDLSPRNVMLSRDGEVKLVDFGIAVTLGASGEDNAGQSAPTGSFPYMSPEQVRKEPLTVQTDLFSVGVLLWEMLVGHRLFARSDPDATLQAVVDSDIVRPSAENPGVPAKLDEVVMRALERDMTRRWASADDMLAALQRYLYSLDETPGPRDVAALVARYCPPETRRFPTHHDYHSDAEPAFDATGPRRTRPGAAPADPADDRAPARPGPTTAVIPRDGAPPRGKRPTRARTETFATHVALEEMLERAGPAAPSAAIGDGDDRSERDRGDERSDGGDLDHRDARDVGGELDSEDERDDQTPLRPRAGRDAHNVRGELDNEDERDDQTPLRPSAGRDARDIRGDLDNEDERDDQTPLRPRAGRAPVPMTDPPSPADPASPADPWSSAGTPSPAGPPPLQMPGRVPPAGSVLVLAGLGAMGLGVAALYVFYQGRSGVERPDAPPRRDARFELVEPDAAPTPVPDAAEPPSDAGSQVPDDAISLDAPPIEPRRDAGIRAPRPGARDPGELAPRVDASVARPTGTATLTIGANPWGNVLLDGKKIGRTPIEHLSVPAGRHVIDVIFGGEDPPRTLKYTVDLADGEAKDVLADFTRP